MTLTIVGLVPAGASGPQRAEGGTRVSSQTMTPRKVTASPTTRMLLVKLGSGSTLSEPCQLLLLAKALPAPFACHSFARSFCMPKSCQLFLHAKDLSALFACQSLASSFRLPKPCQLLLLATALPAHFACQSHKMCVNVLCMVLHTFKRPSQHNRMFVQCTQALVYSDTSCMIDCALNTLAWFRAYRECVDCVC